MSELRYPIMMGSCSLKHTRAYYRSRRCCSVCEGGVRLDERGPMAARYRLTDYHIRPMEAR